MRPMKEYPDLLRILKTYSPAGSDYADQLLKLERRLKNPDMIVPVLGTQGMGKSTLINALLGEDIMPTEADETTCVPVEVRFGAPDRAEVFFSGKAASQTVQSKRELSQYVDNNYNPGNQKRVTHIILYRANPLLQAGLVIVDLPGVGSLTSANEETTKQYIENLCVALFLISTSPPILVQDANFIKFAWRSFNSAFFVQNIWDDNSKAEIQEGLEQNRKVLKDIAQKINVPIQHDIIPVNAYAAAKGAFEQNAELIERSHLKDLTNALSDYAHGYQKRNASDFQDRVKQFVKSVAVVIQDQIRKSQMDEKELSAALEEEREKFEASSREIKKKIFSLKQKINDTRREVRDFSGSVARDCSNKLRAELFQLIDRGVVDGEMLSQAFTDYQTRYIEEATDAVYNKYMEIGERIQPELDELEDIISREEMASPQLEAFNKHQAFKWEKGMDAGIKIGGSIGGIVLGTIIGGPIGFAVGVAVSIVSVFVGGLSRKAVTDTRGRETKQQLEPVLERFRSSLTDAFSKSFEQFADGLTGQLDEYQKARQAQLHEKEKEIEQLQANGVKIGGKLDALERDQDYLTKWNEGAYD